ncbi:hypothetical protein RUM43_003226 [Polyplax serrata]|uniref:Uncharacterized protein n=1 Tax=Polyplax serrata TaxID=468196 RepID=A0AAN8S6E9_POLSC
MTKASIFCFILLQIFVGLCRGENEKNDIAHALHNLQEYDREDFLCYLFGLSILDWARNQPRPPKFLQTIDEDVFIGTLNIPDEKVQEFKKFGIPQESRTKLLSWAKNEFNLSGRDVIELIRTKKCQGPNCVTLGDLGPLCCPW